MLRAGDIIGNGNRRRVELVDRAGADAEVEYVADGRGVGDGDRVRGTVDQRVAPSDASGGPDPGKGRDVLPELRREPGRAGLAAVPGGVDDDVGRERFVDPLRGGRLERCAEHGEERDNAHADHERRRGRGRPPRVADGVLAGEFAGEATDRGDGSSEHEDGGAGRDRAEHDRADQAGYGAERDQPAGRARGSRENGGRAQSGGNTGTFRSSVLCRFSHASSGSVDTG